jgi:hypothetical protein
LVSGSPAGPPRLRSPRADGRYARPTVGPMPTPAGLPKRVSKSCSGPRRRICCRTSTSS